MRKMKVKSETNYFYVDKFSKKEKKFKPKADEVMATFQPDSTEAMATDVMKKTSLSPSRGINLERGFAVFKVTPEKDIASASDSLKNQPDIANTIPVMIDTEGLTRYFLPDEFTVQFKKEVSKEKAESIIKSKGSEILFEQRTPGYYTITVPEGKGLFEIIREFSAMDEVLFAEPSEAGFDDDLAYIPNDPDFSKLWGLRNTGQIVNNVSGSADADIDAPEAWDINRGNRNIIVAVIDTGVDLNHPDLWSNLLPRGSEDWDFADLSDLVPEDENGHGTHVAGTISAVDNTAGIIGVAPKCRIMPLRVNLTSGMNQNRADAINYVVSQAIANPGRRYVINCSWKMSGDHTGVHNAIINAVNNNVVVVFAAGNADQDIDITPQYPAVYPEVIAVAATDQKDRKASPAYGLLWGSNYGTKVDVSAPGVNIYSTYPDDTYAYLDGTSMASPHVAGLAALILSRNPALSNTKVRQIIETTCDNIDAKNPSYVGKLGKGRINAYRALLYTPIGFQLLRKIRFPQKNDGSSTALSFASRFRGRFRYRSILMFLTQKPFSERIYYLNPRTGAVLFSVDPVGNDTIGSLVYDGVNIRVANVTWGTGLINAINPSTGMQVGSIPAPSGRGEGLAYDGKYLYYSTITRIHVIHPVTGFVSRSFPSPRGECRALTYGYGFLFSGNSSKGIITIFNPKTLVKIGEIKAPGGGNAKVEGLAFNPSTKELFIANQDENTIYVGRISL